MKTCLRNCKVGDIILWSDLETRYRVTHPFNGNQVVAVDSHGMQGIFFERYINPPYNVLMRIIKANNEDLPSKL